MVSLAALLAVRAGGRGLLPLDQAIVFEGGHALGCGRVPFVDLAAPAGLPLFLIQRSLFAILGVGWRAYLLHGALLSALGALATYGLLRPRAATARLPLAAAAATAVVFLPPIGVPYPDHGSFLFSGLALLAADRARSRRGGAATLLAVLAGASWSWAFLAKPIPAAFALPLVVFLLRRPEAGARPLSRALSAFVAGSLVTGGATLGLAGVDGGSYLEGLRWLLTVGEGRITRLHADSMAHLRAVVAPAWSVPLPLWLLVGGLAAWSAGRGAEQDDAERSAAWRDRLLSTGLLLASLFYASLTFRSGWTSLGWLPLAWGLAWAPADRRLSAAMERGSGARDPRAARRIRIAGVIAGLACVAWLGFFHVVVNERRGALLLDLRGRLAAQPVPPGLEGLDPVTPAFTATDGESLRGVVAFLRDRPERFFLLGDSSLIYGLAGRCSTSPVLWFHPFLTVPWRGETATVEFQEQLIGRLERERVHYLVVENGGTQMGVTPDTLPRVRDWAAPRTRAAHRFGAFEVFELGAGLAGSASESSPD